MRSKKTKGERFCVYTTKTKSGEIKDGYMHEIKRFLEPGQNFYLVERHRSGGEEDYCVFGGRFIKDEGLDRIGIGEAMGIPEVRHAIEKFKRDEYPVKSRKRKTDLIE